LLGLGKKTDLVCRMKVGRIRLLACRAVVVASVPITTPVGTFQQRRERDWSK
jgi:hypothetical protein